MAKRGRVVAIKWSKRNPITGLYAKYAVYENGQTKILYLSRTEGGPKYIKKKRGRPPKRR